MKRSSQDSWSRKHPNGSTTWHNKKGKCHRLDGPAIERKDGYNEWWVNGQLHREDGPAIIHPVGSEYWYLRGVLHRIGGPAFNNPNAQEWWVNGSRHREDGPAIVYTGGYKEWHLFGERVLKRNFTKKLIRQLKMIRIIET